MSNCKGSTRLGMVAVRTTFFTTVELLIIVATILIMVALWFPVLGKASEKARRVNCAGNLKSLGLALLMYTGDNGGYFMRNPAGCNWYQLGEYDYITTEGNCWSCPSSNDSRTNDHNNSYYYIGSGLKDNNAIAKQVSLAYDASGNHPDNKWMNVLFIDAHVDGYHPGANANNDENPGTLE